MTRVLVCWAEQTSANFGVRALAEGCAALVRRSDPDAEVETQNFGHGGGPINIGVPRTLAREYLLDTRGGRSWIRGFDLVIDLRSGDSFSDIYGLHRLRVLSAFAEFVHACGVPIVIGPQTIGPFRTRQGRVIARRSLRQARLVMARDRVSAEASAGLGRPVDVLTTDVVFALPIPEPDAQRDVVVNVSGLLWSSDAHGSNEDYRATIRALLDGLKEQGREVTLLAHVLDSYEVDTDQLAVGDLARERGLEAIIPTSLTEVRSVLRGSNLVFGSRMHACLNSLSVATPAIPLAYSRKFAPLLSDIGWEHVVSLADPDAAARALEIAGSGADLASAAQEVRARADLLLEPAGAALANAWGRSGNEPG